MFGSNNEMGQLGHKLKQYIDASIDELATRGSSSKVGAHEEAALFKQELGDEIDQLTS